MVPPEKSADGTTQDSVTPINEGTLYVVIRKAVKDALLDVVGTILLVGLAIVLIWFGFTVTASAINSNRIAAFGGIFVILVGCYMALSALEMVPSVSDIR